MSEASSAPTSLRERTRNAVRQSIRESAEELFARQGYEKTTVEQIARAAGMSERSFFRYFPSKEGLVMNVLLELKAEVVERFRVNSTGHDVWTALGDALTIFGQLYQHRASSAAARPTHELIAESPTLAAAFQLGRATLQSELTAVARESVRGGAASPGDPRLDAVVGSALACLEAAERAWFARDQKVEFVKLLEQSMRYLRPVAEA